MILIGEDGVVFGKVSYDQAMLLAHEAGLDLVEVASNSQPPVTRLIDFSKKIYEESKRQRKLKARQKTPELKGVKLGIKIGEHDLQTKANRTREFLAKNHKVRIVIRLKGREMLFRNKVRELMDRFVELTNSQYEQEFKQQGNNFFTIIKKK